MYGAQRGLFYKRYPTTLSVPRKSGVCLLLLFVFVLTATLLLALVA